MCPLIGIKSIVTSFRHLFSTLKGYTFYHIGVKDVKLTYVVCRVVLLVTPKIELRFEFLS